MKLVLAETRTRRRMNRRNWTAEALEDRRLLTSPTVYTVDLTSDTGQGSGTSGDIAYVTYLADNNSNPGGSVINFDNTVFGTPQQIFLQNTLDFSNSVGPIVVNGTGLGRLTINGSQIANTPLVVDVQVAAGTTVSFSEITIGDAYFDGNEYDPGAPGTAVVNHGNLTLTNCSVAQNQAQRGSQTVVRSTSRAAT